MRLLIMGAPGAGKGTQAVALAESAGVPAISTGDIFRANIKAGTALGRRVRRIIEAGEYVPDELTEEIVADRLAEPDAAGGFLLDGFPRTLAQARWLDAHLRAQGAALDAVVSLVVAPDALLARLLRRAEVEGRADDNEETIRRRMEVYAGQTAPLLSHYQEHQLLVEVDGDGDVEQVRERMLASVASHVRHAEEQRERWSRRPR